MDRGDWWATVHGAAKSPTGLKQLNTHTHTHTVKVPVVWGGGSKEPIGREALPGFGPKSQRFLLPSPSTACLSLHPQAPLT